MPPGGAPSNTLQTTPRKTPRGQTSGEAKEEEEAEVSRKSFPNCVINATPQVARLIGSASLSNYYR